MVSKKTIIFLIAPDSDKLKNHISY